MCRGTTVIQVSTNAKHYPKEARRACLGPLLSGGRDRRITPNLRPAKANHETPFQNKGKALLENRCNGPLTEDIKGGQGTECSLRKCAVCMLLKDATDVHICPHFE